MKRLILLFIVLGLNIVAQQKVPVTWSFETKKVSDCEYDLIFKAEIEEGWHLYSLIKTEGDGAPNPTAFKFKKNPNYELVGSVKESKTHKDFDKDLELTTIYHEKTGTFTQRVKLLSKEEIKITGKYDFQTCNKGQCIFPPTETFEFKVKGSDACATVAAATNTTTNVAATGACDTAAILKIKGCVEKAAGVTPPDTAKQEVVSETPANSTKADNECHPWETLLLGLSYGFGAVLMPCIYSLIPLTVSFFLKRSGGRAKGVKNALLYGFFIIFTFVVLTLGITIIFGPTALSNIATNTWLNLFFFILFVVFALSFFGLFEITLPSSWANKLDAKADKGGVIGIFFMALTLVVVSFSCTVGFMGLLLTSVARGDSLLCPFMGFFGFGFGIALPFMLFAFFPTWLSSLPKSGGWMNTFKVTIAFLELALAVKFLANADNVNEWGLITREVFLSLWIGIFAMLTFYLLGVFRTSHDDPPSHLSIGRIIWATFFLSFTVYMIPGLWGAPLRIISSFPPPHHYAESPEGVGRECTGGSVGSVTSTNGSSEEISILEKKRVVGPDGLKLFKNDYESALQYARLVNKPLFIDFTGNACVNCRLMENNVWSKPEVLKLLKDEVVIVSLYVDSKVELPQEQQKEVFWYGKNRVLETEGDKWAFMQTTKYNTSSQPQYVVLDHSENIVSNGIKGAELDAAIFGAWLKGGVDKFKGGK